MKKYYTYMLVDPLTNKPFYIGKGCGKRMYQHYYNRNKLSNQLLARKINKIINRGDKIVYKKIINNVSEQEALIKEIELIEHYGRIDVKTGILCNLTNGGEQGGTSWSQQTKQRKRDQELAKKKGKPILQYSLNGVFIKQWSSAKVAAENTPANRSYITQVCKGVRRSAGGYLWCYKGNPKHKFVKQCYSQVNQYTLNGIYLKTFISLSDAQKATGIELHNISECCRGKSKTAGGYIWKYYNN